MSAPSLFGNVHFLRGGRGGSARSRPFWVGAFGVCAKRLCMTDQTHRFSITGSATHYVEMTHEELRAVEGRYHDLVRDKAVAGELMTRIETRTAHVTRAKASSTPPR